jgi:hypothetical protein
MDVDMAHIDAALTTEEQQKRKKEGRCYYCNRQGHMKRECPKLKDEGKGKETPFKAKARVAKIEEEKEEPREETPPAYDPETLMAHIKKMKIEDRDDFLDWLLVQDNQGF